MINTKKITTITLLSTTFIITMIALIPAIDDSFAQVPQQFHGLTTVKGCEKIDVGEIASCAGQAISADDHNDDLVISMVCDEDLVTGVEVCWDGTVANTGFSIDAVIGAATCADGNTNLPCTLPNKLDGVTFGINVHTQPDAGTFGDTFTVTYQDQCNGSTSGDCDDSVVIQQATSSTTVAEVGITVDKASHPAKVADGTVLPISAVVTNTGSVEITGIAISDSVGTVSCPGTSLDAGNSMTCTGSFTATGCDASNTVTVTGKSQLKDLTASDSEPYCTEKPSVTINKVCEVTGANEITWTIDWQNTGNVALTNVSVDDDRTGNLFTGGLASGETGQDVFAESGLASGLYTNTATITGNSQLEALSASDSAQCRITVPEFEYFVGGGKILMSEGDKRKDNVYLTHGFQLHCDDLSGPNNLEVNWNSGEGRFHLEQLVSATCTDDGSTNEPPPSRDTSENGPGPTTDVYQGEGWGRYNGECGAFAEWVFDDNGEPGKADHIVALRVTDADGGVMLNLNPGDQATSDTSSAGTWKDPTTLDEDGIPQFPNSDNDELWFDLITGNHQWVPHPTPTHGPTGTQPCEPQ